VRVAAAVAAAGLGLLAGGYGFHRLATWAEARGLIYYRTKGRPPAPWLGTLDSIYKPEIEHVIEESSAAAVRADQDDSGADPSAGDRRPE
jgi:hypothetical protein